MKRIVALVMLCAMSLSLLTGCGTSYDLYIYNWGEYIDREVLEIFEERTGYKVSYEEYETNEVMYPKIKSGAVSYDLVCPSDYMIERMIEEDLLAEINFDNVPNLSYIGEEYLEQSQAFDPENKYSIPYTWGTVGILYNTTMVEEPITSWSAIFDEQYADEILMMDSVRDAMGIALKYLGYSLNSTDDVQLEEAKQLLLEQKPLVQAYVVDQVRDKMIGNEAALGVIYSGEALYTMEENEDLAYVVPEEGSNMWIDSWVIPKSAKNKEVAEEFLNFLCEPEIALMNFEEITYSTPNTGARDLIEDAELRESEIVFPGDDIMDRCETFKYLGSEMDEIYLNKWKEVKSN